MKPILTKYFENKTVNQGDNVTLTCETQIDALPIFSFYKLNSTIIAEYNKNNKNSKTFMISKYSKSLQERTDFDHNDYKSIDPSHIVLERRVHSIDSNKDNLADLETVNLRILNAVYSDSGYYLCIVANSIKSFRVTYSFVNVIVPAKTTNVLLEDYVNEVIFDGTKINWSLEHNNHILIGFFVVFILIIVFVSMSFCYCCNHFKNTANKTDKKLFTNPELIAKDSNNMEKSSNKQEILLKTNNLIEKTMMIMNNNNNSNNFVYSPMVSIMNDQNDNLNETKSSLLDTENELEFSREKLKLGRLIDEGAFGRVYLGEAYGIIAGRYKTVVAVKMLKGFLFFYLKNNYFLFLIFYCCLDNPTNHEFENFIKEIEIMRCIGKHENIINLLGICTSKSGPIYAIVEFAKFGNLRNYLRVHRPRDYILYSGIDMDDSQNEEEFSLDDENDEDESEQDNKAAFKNILKLQKQLNSFKTNNNLYSNNKIINSFNSPCLSFTNKSMYNANSTSTTSTTNLMVDLIRFCTQISNGMKYLHSKNICHRDLAARNILLNEFKIAKIADFGLARDLHQNYYYKKKSESPMPFKWLAPEILFDGRAYHNSDQWSFGVLMWEIFTLGGNPYPSVPVENLFDYLKEGNRMTKPMYCDDELYEIILDCWNFKADLRPSFININDKLNNILDKYERKKIEQNAANTTTPIKSIKQHDTPIRMNMFANKLNSPTSKKISSSSSRQSESEDSQYFSGTDTSLVYADSCGQSSSNISCNFSTMSPISCYTNNYSVLPSNNAAAVRAASIMAASLAQCPPSPPPLKPLSRLLNVASAAYDL